jgi:energy-coupling factor transporter ATP-binding protein EcfA2
VFDGVHVKLVTFRILNYRSVNDSGDIAVGQLTSLVGRNEAGKSNLLLALQTLNPAGGLKDLAPIKNFPRQRRLSECNDDTPVVSSTWQLNAKEQAELLALFPRATGVTHVEIGRNYKAVRTVGFVDLKPIAFSADEVMARLRKVRPVAEVEIEKLEAASQVQPKGALDQITTALSVNLTPTDWATQAAPALAAFRKALAVSAASLPEREDGLISELEELAAQITKDGPAWQAARNWAVGLLPVFVYVDDYPELTGHQNIAEYLNRKAANPSQLTDADLNFEKMCKVADLKPQELHQLHSAGDHETRNQLANRASAIVTSELRRLWKDRELKVRFSPDANHLDTFISDPNSVYDVEVNLNERSRGLKWFFSFYITFSADTKGGSAQNAILLLDEPGL